MGDVISSPTASPTSAGPTPAPTEPRLCYDGDEFHPGAPAGYGCTTTDDDSNFGGTEENCLANGGVWYPYDCAGAEAYYTALGEDDDELRPFFRDAWEPRCCGDLTEPPPPPPPPTDGLCYDGEDLNDEAPAGYSCTTTLEDSNFGGTEENCLAYDGEWNPYNCATAEAYYDALEPDNGDRPYFRDAWEPKCCGDLTLCRGDVLDGGAFAGYACLVEEISVGDSNFDFSEADCDEVPGIWTPYDCTAALLYYDALEGDYDFFRDAWAPLCCVGAAPATSDAPSSGPSSSPSSEPTDRPSSSPSGTPSDAPSSSPTYGPSISPSTTPSESPSVSPSAAPSDGPSNGPSTSPSDPCSDSGGRFNLVRYPGYPDINCGQIARKLTEYPPSTGTLVCGFDVEEGGIVVDYCPALCATFGTGPCA